MMHGRAETHAPDAVLASCGAQPRLLLRAQRRPAPAWVQSILVALEHEAHLAELLTDGKGPTSRHERRLRVVVDSREELLGVLGAEKMRIAGTGSVSVDTRCHNPAARGHPSRHPSRTPQQEDTLLTASGGWRGVMRSPPQPPRGRRGARRRCALRSPSLLRECEGRELLSTTSCARLQIISERGVLLTYEWQARHTVEVIAVRLQRIVDVISVRQRDAGVARRRVRLHAHEDVHHLRGQGTTGGEICEEDGVT